MHRATMIHKQPLKRFRVHTRRFVPTTTTTTSIVTNSRHYTTTQQKPFATQQLHDTHFTKEIVYYDNKNGVVSDNKDKLSFQVKSVKASEDTVEHELHFRSTLMNWIWRHAIVHLLPQKYPQSVKSNYLKFAKWQSLQYIISSVGGVLSMQSMLYAVGVGSGSLPLAAALNWIIKDGLGQLGGVIFASRVNTNFDADPKKWRVRGELALLASTCLEICTPLFPGLFVPIASIANVGKNISCLASSATRAAINNSFITMDNLADVTAKSGSQAIASSLIGTGLAICISPIIGTSFSAVFPAFVALSAVQLFALYKAVSCVELNILNLQRVELVLSQYLLDGQILDPLQISKKETFLFSYKSVLPGTLVINPKLDAFCFAENVVECIQKLRSATIADNYLLNVNLATKTVCLLFLKEASTAQVVLGVFHASILRKLMFSNSTTDEQDIHTLSRVKAVDSMETLLKGMSDKGWITDNDFIEERPNRIEFHN